MYRLKHSLFGDLYGIGSCHDDPYDLGTPHDKLYDLGYWKKKWDIEIVQIFSLKKGGIKSPNLLL